jgi:DNA-binding IclR family transcriptional regulator
MTVGEFNPGVVGVSAPVFNRSGQILGSIGVTGAEYKFNSAEISRIARLVIQAAEQVTSRIADMSIGMDRPPRAIG